MEAIIILVAIVALIFWVASIQSNNKSKILILQVFANIFYAIEYTLLGAFPAVGMNLVSVIRSMTYYENIKKNRENSIIQLLVFNFIIIIWGIITYNGLLTIIPIIITILYTYSSWQKNNKVIRFIFVFAACGWLYYNFSVGAYIFVIGNIIELVFGIISIVRFDLIKKKKA